MKTKEELKALKEEVDIMNKKLAELTGDELEKVTGGAYWSEKLGLCQRGQMMMGDHCLYPTQCDRLCIGNKAHCGWSCSCRDGQERGCIFMPEENGNPPAYGY